MRRATALAASVLLLTASLVSLALATHIAPAEALTVPCVLAPMGGQFTAVDDCGGGGGGSTPPPTPPQITSQPMDSSTTYGQPWSTSVGDTESPQGTYQWQYSSTGLGGTFANLTAQQATTNTYGSTSGLVSQTGYYQVVITNSNGSVPSSAAHITVSQAALHIVANNKAMIYGAVEPALDATYGDGIPGESLVNGDTAATAVSGTLTCSTSVITTTTAPGSYPITCSGVTSANYALTFVGGSLVISVAPQAISFSFNQSSGIKVGTSSTLVATGGGSGKPVLFTVDASSSASACSLSGTNGSNASFTGVGTCIIDANQAAAAPGYSAAPQVQQIIAVTKTAQTISFAGLPGSNYLPNSYQLNATGGGSGNPVTFSLDTTNPLFYTGSCTLSGSNNSTVTLVHAQGAAGYCMVIANQAGSALFSAAAPVVGYVNSLAPPQVISFTPPATGSYGSTAALSATGGGSGNPVTYSVAGSSSALCSISGQTVSYNGAGSCVINANQAGSADYAAAGQVQGTVVITRLPQTITFGAIASARVGGSAVVVATGGGSGNPVIYSLDPLGTPGSCSIGGDTVTFLAAGNCIVTATQAGNANYLAMTDSLTIVVAPGAQFIGFTGPSDAVYGGIAVLSAMPGASGSPVTFSVDAASDANACSVSGDEVYYNAAGNCVIDADEAGTANYDAASQVSQAISIAPGDLVVTAVDGTMTYGANVPTLATLYTGLVNLDTNSSLTTEPTCVTDATSTSAVGGSYSVTCFGAIDPNYSISYVAGSMSVTPAPLVITASDGSAQFGQVPVITPLYDGFVGGDDASDLTAAPNCTTSATTASSPGGYTSECSGAVDPNYSISYITASDATSAYGSGISAVVPSYSGFVGTDTVVDLSALPTCSTVAVSGSPVGNYATNCGGAVDANYTIDYATGDYAITAVPLSVTASDVRFVHGAAVPAVVPLYAGFVNGDDSGDLTKPASCQGSAVSSSAPGSYVTSCSGVDDVNYAVSYSSGVAVVDAAPLSAVASSVSTTADTETPAVTDDSGSDTSSSGTGHSSSTTASGNSDDARPTRPATGGGFELLGSSTMLTIGVILVLLVLVGGGVLFFVRRRRI
jgi:hypothetical protein